MRKVIFILSIIFVIFSFSPSLYELYHAKDLPEERTFVLEHNYMFDYNFYLSRIRQGQEGKWLVTEKYYNMPHTGSLMQVFYLYLGKIGGLLGLSVPAVYHGARLLMGLMLLMMIGMYGGVFFSQWWVVVSFLLIVTSGSWPIPVRLASGGWRFATHMGWWSAIDSLQRITFLPHVVLGQIFILVFIWRFGGKLVRVLTLNNFAEVSKNFSAHLPNSPRRYRRDSNRWACSKNLPPRKISLRSHHPHQRRRNFFSASSKMIGWGIVGFLVGIVFPPTLVVVYTVFLVMTGLEAVGEMRGMRDMRDMGDMGEVREIRGWVVERVLPRVVFILLSFPALVYLQLIFKVMPWKALALFDIKHRTLIPYKEYAAALGPVLPLGIVGLIVALVKKEKKFLPVIAWILSVGLLFIIFEKVPQQSPLRFTEAVIHIPLGILATYFFFFLWQVCKKKIGLIGPIGLNSPVNFKIYRVKGLIVVVMVVMTATIIMGVLVMGSMVGWLTDQGRAKREGGWLVPIATQLVYPLDDFMEAVYYLRDNTKKEEVILGYITASNFIPAYAGNYTYIGHANTPDEWEKNEVVKEFLAGKMSKKEAGEFLKKERISYVFFGPQEKEIWDKGDGPVNSANLQGKGDLGKVYPFVEVVFENGRVRVYRVEF